MIASRTSALPAANLGSIPNISYKSQNPARSDHLALLGMTPLSHAAILCYEINELAYFIKQKAQ